MNIHQGATAVNGSFGGFPPHNIEAEQCLLGAILINNHAFERVDSIVTVQDFYEPAHQAIYDVCQSLISEGKLATPITVKDFLPADLDIGGLTLAQYLACLASEGTTIINAPDYAKTVRDLANRRRLISAGEDFIAILKMAPVDMAPAEIAADTIERLDEIATGQVPAQLRVVSMRDAGREALDQLSAAIQGGGKAKAMTWGFDDLDRLTDGGIHRGELSIPAGRPGMCKTGLAVHIALSSAAEGYRILFCSLEMTAAALAQRALTAIAHQQGGTRIAYSDLRSGYGITEAKFRLLRDAQDQLDTLPLVIEQQPGLTIAQLTMRARRHQQRKGLDLLIIDHIHKIRPADRYRGDPTAEIGEISNAAAALAKELNIGVIALCQLSRKIEERYDKRPQLADLRQSGSLEQDADVVLFPYREGYYLQAREPAPGTIEHIEWVKKLQACQDRLEINIAKQRQGATGIIKCFTAIECNVFYSEASDRSGD